ncbi:DMT family transporter [Acuticoccus sp. I52.16.1]|uniref:DMT family transporter n=1 Tax=Acuticoccus sp. I52.16.1 TaxID=2928472 RepID=UPI001FD17FF0|nr:DMT family transporter [Acuticoccus sp. I52.16.1]UOM34062.1 DMT family transporter [Acuticoccus sp. I52.16.1]
MSVIATPRTLTDQQAGIALGLVTVAIWGAYLAMNRYGTASGLTMADLTLLRFGPAALILLPWLLRHDPARLAGVGWRRGLVMTLVLGPGFMYLAVGGYYFAPLAHGAVFQPSGLIVSGLVLGALVLGESVRPIHILGMAVIISGLALVAGPTLFSGGTHAFIGDMLFFTAGSCWALFTVLAKKWATPPIAAAAIIAVLSSAVFVPYYLATQSFDRLAALPLPNLLSQLAVQGVLAAVVATVTFTRAAQLIGAGRVSAFPALVPGLAILIGVPITGEWPGPVQVLGIAVVVLGLLISIGAFHRPRR